MLSTVKDNNLELIESTLTQLQTFEVVYSVFKNILLKYFTCFLRLDMSPLDFIESLKAELEQVTLFFIITTSVP